MHQGNDLGYGNNGKDWIIRSQVLRAEMPMDAVQRLDVGRLRGVVEDYMRGLR